MNVRDRAKQAEIQAAIAALAEDTTAELRPYSGAGSFADVQIGRPEAVPTDARGRAAHRARREFVEEELRPAAEALAKAQAIHNAGVVATHEELSQLISSKVNLDAQWKADGNSGGNPILAHFTRGAHDPSSHEVDAFYNGGAFLGFRQSDAFKKYYGTSVESKVLEIFLEWMSVQNIDSTDARNWQRVCLLLDSAGFVLPDPAFQSDAPSRKTAAERIVYGNLTGKSAIAAMPSEEMKRRLKADPDFASLVEEVSTGKPLSAAIVHSKTRPADYSTKIILRGFPMKTGTGANERVELVDLTQELLERLPSGAYREAVTRMTGEPLLSVADAIKKNDGVLDELRATHRRLYGR